MFYILLAMSICATDLFIKYWIETKRTFKDKTYCLGGNVLIEKSHNQGACLNFMEKKPNYVLGVSGIVFGVLLCFFAILLSRKGHRVTKLATSFLAGGAAGNFFDRMHRGYVVDYLNFPKVKKLAHIDFNFSDLFLSVGGAILLIASIFSKD